MDKRITELRDRLYKKKAEARPKENVPVRLGAHSTHNMLHTLEITVITCGCAVNCMYNICYFDHSYNN